ncbi:MAG: HAD family phosphatase [Nibricoccus sp.]
MRIEADALFWDHDGLLVETEMLFYSITRDLVQTKGIEITEDLWSSEYLSKARGTTAIVADFGLRGAEAEAIIEIRNRRYYELLEDAPPLCPFARETLTALKKRFPMALVTGNSRRAINIVHRTTCLLSIFDDIITQDDFPNPKPAPDCYLLAARRLGAEPSRCVAIEDSERGMNAALSAGMRCIVVPSALTKRQKFDGALAIEPSLERLPMFLHRRPE